MDQPYQDELAQLYDVAVPDWPDEVALYHQLAQDPSLFEDRFLKLHAVQAALQLA